MMIRKRQQRAEPSPGRLRVLLVLGLFFMASCSGPEPTPPTSPATASPVFPDAPIILISIDTLRADHLPDYGYQAIETPALSALRRDSILFEKAYSHSPLTLPSHLSAFTGLLPQDHGVRNNIGYRFDGDQHTTLAALLRKRGYATGGAISAYVLRGSTGVSAGFDFYDDRITSREDVAVGRLQRSGQRTAEVGLRWISEQAARPFFFFLHLFEPHTPYTPPEPYRGRYDLAYDGEIAAVDEVVGTFLSRLRELGVYDRAVIVLMSDHGEGLGDHGEQEHGIFLYREALQVPLMLKLPASARGGESYSSGVQLIDLFPTLTALAGVTPNPTTGLSLLDPTPRKIYSETLYPRIHLGWSELRSLIDGPYHLIQGPRRELFHMGDDPGEKVDLVTRQRRVDQDMTTTLEDFASEVTLPSDFDPEVAEKLAALGYVGSVKGDAGAMNLPDPKDRIGEIEELRHAFALSAEARFTEAVAVLRGLVAKNPRFMDAWNKLALTLDAAGLHAEALDAYQRALGFEPSLATEYALAMSLIHLRLEQFDQAVAHAELALDRHPAKARLLLARVALEQGRPEVAEKHVSQVLDNPNEGFRAAVVLVRIRAAQKRLAEALQLATETRRRVADADAGPVESLAFVHGDVLARLNRGQEAEAAFREEIEHFPRQRQTYANLALLLMVQKRVDEARELFEKLSERSPSRETCLFAAETLDYLGDRQTAEAWRRRASNSPKILH